MKRTSVPFRSRLFIAVGAASALGAAACADPCRDDGNTAICGDFGDLSFAVTPDEPLRWPAVTTDRGSILVSSNSGLLEVGGGGDIQVVQPFSADPGSTLPGSSAASVGEDGTAFVVVGGGVGAYADSGAQTRWNASVGGRSTASPPALGTGVVHVTTSNEDGSERTLTSLELGTGEVVSERPGASTPVASDDDGVIYLSGSEDCGASFAEIVAEDVNGAVKFRHREDSLIRDFSPGPDGEIYIVNGNRELVRISSDGTREWSFSPSCADCTVAGAPTVTDDTIYFPVWQGRPANEGCGDPDPTTVEQEEELATDPLYALTRSGDLKWSYDGFTTLAQRYQGGGGAMGVLGLSFSPRVHHHPSGRPIIADDGTLYVPADGAMVALDADGTELGYAVMNPQNGEQRTGDGTMGSTNTPGFSAPPTLADDGKLYVYDGLQVRAFETKKKPAHIPWTAPFGGNRNTSRLSR